jgi:hypothetical protein
MRLNDIMNKREIAIDLFLIAAAIAVLFITVKFTL